MDFVFVVVFSGLITIADYNNGGTMEYWALVPNTETPPTCDSGLTPHEALLTFDLGLLSETDQDCIDEQSSIRQNADEIASSAYSCRPWNGRCKIVDSFGTPPPAGNIMRTFDCHKDGSECALTDKTCDVVSNVCKVPSAGCQLPNFACQFVSLPGIASRACVLENSNRLGRGVNGEILVLAPTKDTELEFNFNKKQALGPVNISEIPTRADLFVNPSSDPALIDSQLLSGTLNPLLDTRIKIYSGSLKQAHENVDIGGNTKMWCFDNEHPKDCKPKNGTYPEKKLYEKVEWRATADKSVSISYLNQARTWNLELKPKGKEIRISISNLPKAISSGHHGRHTLDHFAWVYNTSRTQPPLPCPVPYIRSGTLGGAGGGVFCPVDRGTGSP